MKKMLTTLMVLAIAFTAVSATAGDVDWKFYGKVHASINMLNNGENSQIGLTSNTSRFGFKGSAAMTETFTFVWQFEQKLNLAQTGNEVLSNRNSYVGFKNANFGEVRMGIHDSPHKTLGRKTTYFFDTIGDNRTVTFGTDTRETDILAWVSPNWSGFGLFLAYQFDKDGSKLDPAAAADAEFYSETLFSGMATYTADNFLVGASWIMFGEGYNAVGGADRGDSPTVLRFAGKYSAEKFGIAGQFLTVGAQDFDGTDYVDVTAQTIGGEVIFHANEKYDVKGGYYMADPNTDADDDDYSLLTIGIDRNFSKSLQMYVQYAMLSNSDAANGTLGGIGSGPNGFGKKVSGWMNEDGGYENPSGFSWGMAYKW